MYSLGQSTLAPVPKGVTVFSISTSNSSLNSIVPSAMFTFLAIYINIYLYIFIVVGFYPR